MKVLLVSNTTWNIFNFRMSLADALRDRGAEVVVVGVADGFEDNIRDLGYGWAEWKITRRSLNPFSELGAFNNLRRVYARERPDIVQHYTIKPVLYGTAAARVSGVGAVVNSVTGLPHMITSKPDRGIGGLGKRVSLGWYARCCIGKGRRALFQNVDDVDALAKYAPSLKQSAVLLPGSGVDLDRFPFQPLEGRNPRDVIRVVCVARLIREKGVVELVEAARQILRNHNNVEFVFCGSPDQGNRTSIDDETLRGWKSEPGLNFAGHVLDVRSTLSSADIVVLPSYREGTPRCLLEAAAIGRPIVTTNVAGCRETVEDGETGILVPARDSSSLAAAISRLIDDRGMRESMGRAGRRLAESRFDERIVVERTLRVYEELIGLPG